MENYVNFCFAFVETPSPSLENIPCMKKPNSEQIFHFNLSTLYQQYFVFRQQSQIWKEMIGWLLFKKHLMNEGKTNIISYFIYPGIFFFFSNDRTAFLANHLKNESCRICKNMPCLIIIIIVIILQLPTIRLFIIILLLCFAMIWRLINLTKLRIVAIMIFKQFKLILCILFRKLFLSCWFIFIPLFPVFIISSWAN